MAEDLNALERYCTEALLDAQLPPFLRAKFELISSVLPGRNPRQHLNEALESIEGMQTKLRANGLEEPEILIDLKRRVEARAVDIRTDELEAEAAGIVLSDYNPGTIGGEALASDDDIELEDDVVSEGVQAGGSDEDNDGSEGSEAEDGDDVVSEDVEGEGGDEDDDGFEGSEAEDGDDVVSEDVEEEDEGSEAEGGEDVGLQSPPRSQSQSQSQTQGPATIWSRREVTPDPAAIITPPASGGPRRNPDRKGRFRP